MVEAGEVPITRAIDASLTWCPVARSGVRVITRTELRRRGPVSGRSGGWPCGLAGLLAGLLRSRYSITCGLFNLVLIQTARQS